MTIQTFHYTYVVHAPATAIYEHLAEPMNYIGLSPLIGKITDVKRDTDEQHRSIVTYKTIESFRFLGFITYPNSLNVVTTLAHPNRQIVTDVQSGFNVRVRFIFDLKEQTDGTTITETITATVPALLSSFVVNQAKAVQQHRAKTLKQRMESQNQKGG